MPPPATVARIALACGFSAEFFSAVSPPEPNSISKPFFRSLRSTRQWERDEAEARATLVWQVANAIENHVNLPELDFPDLHLHESDAPAAAAERATYLRQLWKLPEGPVGNITRLLEAHGAVCARISGKSQRVDAFSQWMDGHPFVILWRTKADTARSRFDAAHELAHLVLHPDPEPGNKLLEDQAHAFAAEFTMPCKEVLDELPTRPPRKGDLDELIATRERWGVSLAALFYRARELGTISREAHRRSMIRLSDFGYRTREPGDLGAPERPELLGSALQLIADAIGWGLKELTAEVRLPVSLVREICSLDEEAPSGNELVSVTDLRDRQKLTH
jgi:Zn-dependent peptidase ImmA (M78 family)